MQPEDNAPSGGGRGPAAVRDMMARRAAGWTLDMLWERWCRGDVEHGFDVRLVGMIEKKIAEAEHTLAAQPGPMAITLYATKTSPGYVDTPTNWTVHELRWLIAQAEHPTPSPGGTPA